MPLSKVSVFIEPLHDSPSVLCPQLREVASLLCGSSTRATIMANTKSRSREGLRSNSVARRKRRIAAVMAFTAPWGRERMISKGPSAGASASPLSTARIASACWSDNAERLAMVRLMMRFPSRTDSRSKMAGRELRFGTMSMYMGACIAHAHLFALIWSNQYMGTFRDKNDPLRAAITPNQALTTLMRTVLG